MNEHNPYAAPSANLGGKDSYAQETGGVTQGVVEQLARTKGWTRFMGVVLILVAVLMVLVIVRLAEGAKMFLGLFDSNVGKPVMFVMLAVAAIHAVIYLVAGIKLHGFSSAVQRLLYSGRESDLEDALDRQRSFWLFLGILGIIGVVFFGLGVVGAISTPRAPFSVSQPQPPAE